MDGPANAYDRAAESLGNVVELQHVNLRIPDQQAATAFYISGLGLTRDPFLMTGTDNMWANAGASQFHLPTGAPQVLRGTTGLVVPDRAQLLERLARVRRQLEGTRFGFEETADGAEATCPWGNRVRCHAPDASRFGPITLGIPYVEFDVAPGTVAGIARFYREIVGAPAWIEDGGGVARALVPGTSTLSSARPIALPRPSTATTSRSRWPISVVPMKGCGSAGWCRRRTAPGSTASATSWTWTAARCCSRWSTRCAA